MKTYRRQDFPVSQIRRYLECGPTVLIGSAHKGETDIMTQNWHTVMEFAPALVGCIIAPGAHSHGLIRKSRECTINLPEAHMAETVARIGNCHGGEIDKFAEFGLTAVAGDKVAAPMIAECYASFECRLADTSMIGRYAFFIFEVVKAHVAARPRYPKTMHYRGQGVFMLSGENKSYRRLFRPENL
jgi:flavin reductase (DIM6/NTAB) family NADH-FMN oxidoreductase RutF